MDVPWHQPARSFYGQGSDNVQPNFNALAAIVVWTSDPHLFPLILSGCLGAAKCRNGRLGLTHPRQARRASSNRTPSRELQPCLGRQWPIYVGGIEDGASGAAATLLWATLVLTGQNAFNCHLPLTRPNLGGNTGRGYYRCDRDATNLEQSFAADWTDRACIAESIAAARSQLNPASGLPISHFHFSNLSKPLDRFVDHLYRNYAKMQSECHSKGRPFLDP